MAEPQQPDRFEACVVADIAASVDHPADLTPEQRAHLGLPAEPDQQEQQ